MKSVERKQVRRIGMNYLVCKAGSILSYLLEFEVHINVIFGTEAFSLVTDLFPIGESRKEKLIHFVSLRPFQISLLLLGHIGKLVSWVVKASKFGTVKKPKC